MELSSDQIALLRAIADIQGESEDEAPSTIAVGERLHVLYQERGTAYSWIPTAPWHATEPMAKELEALGLIEVWENEIASYKAPEAPAPIGDTDFGLLITSAGRAALRAAMAASDRDEGQS